MGVLIKAVLLVVLCGFSSLSLACIGCNQTVTLTINQTIGTSGNVAGHTEASSSFHLGAINTQLVGFLGGDISLSFTRIDGTLPPYPTRGSSVPVFQPIDDYFAVAVSVTDRCGSYYMPHNAAAISVTTCRPGPGNGVFAPSTWDSELKILRPLINGTYARNIFLGRFGACRGFCATPTITLANIYLNYNITVPQTCVINAGQIVTVDFGNVSTGAFNSAGARASGVAPIARNLGIKCSNIDAYANLSLRVQADNVAGNALVSTNKDVGFVITDASDRPLTPNDFSSVLPFKLDGATSANVTIKVYPVSVTGARPAEGPVTSQGYLRIDFA